MRKFLFMFTIPLLMGSCTFGGKTVSYEVVNKDGGSIYVVPQVAPKFASLVSSNPICPSFYPPGVGTALYSTSFVAGSETNPTDIFQKLKVYHNSVLVRTVVVNDGVFERSEIQYPLNPTQVHYMYYLQLTSDETNNLVEVPTDPGFSVIDIGPSAKRIQWKPLVNKAGNASGVKYRAVLQLAGSFSTVPDELLDSEVDVHSADFQNLISGTNYSVTVYFGDMIGHLSSYPTFSLQVQ